MYNTGSIGITPFYLAGAAGIAAIAIGTGVYLFIKKKSTNKNRSEK
jgi:LPXTG-motif cell wall-anchored protein